MEDIEVGEYVKFKDGSIDRIKDIINTHSDRKLIAFEKRNSYLSDLGLKKQIVNHSKKIIELIEKGDYYNGIQVVHKLKNGKIQLSNGYLLSNEDIRKGDNIVTKEQFNSVKYVI